MLYENEKPDKPNIKEVLFVIILLLICFGIPYLAIDFLTAWL